MNEYAICIEGDPATREVIIAYNVQDALERFILDHVQGNRPVSLSVDVVMPDGRRNVYNVRSQITVKSSRRRTHRT